MAKYRVTPGMIKAGNLKSEKIDIFNLNKFFQENSDKNIFDIIPISGTLQVLVIYANY